MAAAVDWPKGLIAAAVQRLFHGRRLDRRTRARATARRNARIATTVAAAGVLANFIARHKRSLRAGARATARRNARIATTVAAAGVLANFIARHSCLSREVIKIERHLDGTGPMRVGRVVFGVAKLAARVIGHGFGQVLLKKVVERVLFWIHAALSAVLCAKPALCETPVLFLARNLARALAAR